MMPNCQKLSPKILSLLVVGILLGGLGSSQSVWAEPLLTTTGLVHEDPDSAGDEAWTYLSWRESIPGALGNTPVAIFRSDAVRGDGDPNFAKRALLFAQTDPRTIEARLNLAEYLNDDRTRLRNHLLALFGDQLDDPEALELPQLLSALIEESANQTPLREQLEEMAFFHPVLNLALGRGFAETVRVPGVYTYEVRRWNLDTQSSEEVLGRVILDTGDPREYFLPAPGAPVEVQTESAQGHLVARLRWATPNSLRELDPLHQGYHVYRVEEALAIAQGWHVEAPAREELLAEIGQGTEVVRANTAPVLTGGVLNQAEAEDMTPPPGAPAGQDPAYFFADHGDRFQPEGEGLADGDRFYYFVAASDILGRPGHFSEGTLVMICSRIPPLPPEEVWVEPVSEYTEGSDGAVSHLAVRWTPAEEEVDRYYVYRFTSLPEMQQAIIADPSTSDYLIAGPIDADDPEYWQDNHFRLVDDGSFPGPTGPAAALFPGPGDEGTPFYYTIRVQRASACEGNLSAHSAPVWGILRAIEGPGEVDATLSPYGEIITLEAPTQIVDTPVEVEAYGNQILHLLAERENPGITWAEFSLEFDLGSGESSSEYLGRVEFAAGSDRAGVFYLNSAGQFTAIAQRDIQLTIRCRVGGPGLTPEEETVIFGPIDGIPGWNSAGFNGNAGEVVFIASLLGGYDLPGSPPDFHQTTDPDGQVRCPRLTIHRQPGDRATEWRVYRRVDNGPPQMVHQTAIPEDEEGDLEWDDCSLPVRGGTVCYYVQAVDEEGNAGPLTAVGCLEMTPPGGLPTPLLFPLESTGTPEEPLTRISWFCSPEGVDRFELLVATDQGEPPLSLGRELSPRRSVGGTDNGEDGASILSIYDTQRVGAGLRGDIPEYFVDVPLDPGITYTVEVRAVGPGPFTGRNASGADDTPIPERQRGPLSNAEEYLWTSPLEDPDLVPWPIVVAALDTVTPPNLGLDVFFLNPTSGVGVRIGDFYFFDDEGNPFPMPERYPYPLPVDLDPNEAVYPDRALPGLANLISTDRTLLPAVLYRYQIPNALYPEVSPRLVQVSPLIDRITFQEFREHGAGGDVEEFYRENPDFVQLDNFNALQDPYLAVRVADQSGPGTRPTHELILLDNQTLLAGAAYRYLLVRFTEAGEIDRIFPVPPLDLAND